MLDQIFLASKHNANPLNILVNLQLLCTQRGNELLVISQCLSIQSTAPSATIWPSFERGVLRSPILSGKGLLGGGGRDLYQSKAHPRLPNTSQYKVLLNLPTFIWNSNVKLCSQIRPFPRLGGKGWT